MTNLLKIPTWADDENVHAIVETPRGSTCKLDFDPKLRVFTLAKPLMAGLTYPYDWGFIPSTKAQDGDPLDVLVIHDAQTYPGVVLRCRPVGILEVGQTSKGKKKRNDRVFGARPLSSRDRSEGHPPFRPAHATNWSASSAPRTRSKTRNSSFWDGAAQSRPPRPSSGSPHSFW
jgi:inorganic pyrophosphatase